MNIIQNFRFQTNVSIDTYQSKQEATACLSAVGAKAVGKSKMAFMEQSVSIAEFLGLATSGHAFCNLFDFDPDKKYWIETTSGQHYLSYPVYRKGANTGATKLFRQRLHAILYSSHRTQTNFHDCQSGRQALFRESRSRFYLSMYKSSLKMALPLHSTHQCKDC